MKKVLFLSAAFAAMALVSANAQDLDTVNVSDQFDVGTSRGNDAETGTGSFGASNVDGSDALAYSGSDATGTINYINTYSGGFSGAGDAAGESPIVDVVNTGASNVDRQSTPIPLPANTRPGATDGNTAVIVCDDGGTNNLFFGESDDSDYFVEVDMYVWDRTAIAGDELGYIALRSGRNAADEPDTDTFTTALTVDREQAYYIAVDYHNLTVDARFSLENSDALGAGTGYTELSTPAAITEGWHTFRIEANGTNIDFSVDGSVFHSITNATLISGRGALGHRESGVAGADEIASVFDNLKAGPAVISSVDHWSLYSH